MNPPSGPANEIKMQVIEQQSQSRFVLLENSSNEFAVHGPVVQQYLYRFGPGAVDFFFTHGFIAIAQVQADKSQELPHFVFGSGLSQIWNGHAVHLLVCKNNL
jgi:hypothetical protein